MKIKVSDLLENNFDFHYAEKLMFKKYWVNKKKPINN